MRKKLFVLTWLIFIAFVFNTAAITRYVNLNNPTPSTPFTDWATAATSIQDAIDAAVDGDLVLVTNGVYNTGGRTVGSDALTNRVVIDRQITIQSVNGPEMTIIAGNKADGLILGSNAIRCVYMVSNSTLIGFSLTNGSTIGIHEGGMTVGERCGGGVFCSSMNSNSSRVVNCFIGNNSAFQGAGVWSVTVEGSRLSKNITVTEPGTGGQIGGAAMYSRLMNCLIVGNEAQGGGGAYGCVVQNCTVVSNYARPSSTFGGVGGGLSFCQVNNSIVYHNVGGYEELQASMELLLWIV
ncbi:MAG: hypothetical protein QM813_09695 [Verrucomicrobiota bacterium]